MSGRDRGFAGTRCPEKMYPWAIAVLRDPVAQRGLDVLLIEHIATKRLRGDTCGQ